MLSDYKLEPITHEFLDAIGACDDSLELRKLALRIICETNPDAVAMLVPDPVEIGACTNVIKLRKLIGNFLMCREGARLAKKPVK